MGRACSRQGTTPSSGDPARLPGHRDSQPHTQNFPTLSSSLSDISFGKFTLNLIPKEMPDVAFQADECCHLPGLEGVEGALSTSFPQLSSRDLGSA